VVNSALLGAFVAALGDPDIEIMCDVIEQTVPAKAQQNIAACREAYQQLCDAA
jgi:Pyruvate/2-oxoacid:ferredoxin oxidoreductase gamma subunit